MFEKSLYLLPIILTSVCGEGILSVFSALNQMRPLKSTAIGSIRETINDAIPGVSYPVLSEIPFTSFNCSQVNRPGYYADPEAMCQVYRRCESDDDTMFSYLCPNKTLFNQVTLICDWWYNVDCSLATAFYSYSNPKLYQFTPDPEQLSNEAVSTTSTSIRSHKSLADITFGPTTPLVPFAARFEDQAHRTTVPSKTKMGFLRLSSLFLTPAQDLSQTTSGQV